MKRIHIVSAIFLLLGWTGTSYATFNSGSTGALGALAFNTMSSARHSTLPVDGVLNYTTVNIPSGVTVTFIRNAANTSVYMLATGDITINGTINLNGGSASNSVGQGGPGGFSGGFGATNSDPAGRGLGPGGGYPGANTGCANGGGGGFGTAGTGACGPSSGQGGSAYGNVNLFPLIGGSGGGGCGVYNNGLINGGGGGGAILIAASGNLYLNGSITANGGAGTWVAGSGSGGGIRLMANNIFGNGSLAAAGGNGSVTGGAGRIRLEA